MAVNPEGDALLLCGREEVLMEEFATRFDATFDVRGHVLVAFDSPLDLLGTDRGRVLG